MGYVGGKISGHSGTEFKHRTAFDKLREHHKSSRSDTQQPLKSKPYRKGYETRSPVILKLLALLSLLAAVTWVFVLFCSKTNDVLEYESPPFYHSEVLAKKKNEERILSYHQFVGLGNQHLALNQHKPALNRYNFAIGLGTGLTDVYEGYTKALFLYCTTDGFYCHQTLEYLDYVSQLDFYTEEEIIKMRERVIQTMSELPITYVDNKHITK